MTVQLPVVPLHAPPHPANVLPPVTVDVSVSEVPCTISSAQSPLWDAADTAHEIPGPVIVPVPVPDVPATTVTTYFGGGGGAKLASTFVFWLIVSVHVVAVPVDAQAPPHPMKLPPLAAAAVSVSCVPDVSVSLQSPACDDVPIEQLIPVPLTAPAPLPLAPARIVTV